MPSWHTALAPSPTEPVWSGRNRSAPDRVPVKSFAMLLILPRVRPIHLFFSPKLLRHEEMLRLWACCLLSGSPHTSYNSNRDKKRAGNKEELLKIC